MKDKLFNWIGGKKWLEPQLNITFSRYYNKKITDYAVPFSGGLGSFLFTINTLKYIGIKNFHLNDINSSIINTYKNRKRIFKFNT